MNILVTLDANYLKPLKVMLKSLFLHHPNEKFSIYLMHSSLRQQEIDDVRTLVETHGHRLSVITLKEKYFRDATLVKHYTKEMYYRLLAFKFLPKEIDKILYLDPDILIINNLRDLYHLDLSGYLFAAACHNLPMTELNRLRLKSYDIQTYYNSGVLLMNLYMQRDYIVEQEIYDYVKDNKKKLLLPDQDVINALYSKNILTVDETLYNYDPRFYYYYKMTSNGKIDMDYVIYHTRILHFCGKKKPWRTNYSGKFHALYKHYEKEALLKTKPGDGKI